MKSVFDEAVVRRAMSGDLVTVRGWDRREIVRRMALAGYTDGQIAFHARCTHRSALRIRTRLGIPGQPIGTNEHTRRHDAPNLPWAEKSCRRRVLCGNWLS